MVAAKKKSREWIEVTTFGDLVVRGAARFCDAEAVVLPEARHTYRSLEAAAFKAARSLLGLGVGRGDKVGILMPNCVDFVEVMFGAALIGAVVVPINARSKGRELAYVVGNADVKVLLTSDIIDQHTDYVELLHYCLPRLSSATDVCELDLPELPILKSVVLLGQKSPAGMLDRQGFEALAEHVSDLDVERLRAQIRVRDIAIMLYTSGTTADPKGCPLTHEALVRTAVEAGRTRFELTAHDVFWDPLPMFHMSAILPLVACLHAGTCFVTLTHFEPGTGIRQLKKERATICFSTFPPVTTALMNHPDWDAAVVDRIRLMNNVAPPDALRDIHAALPTIKHINAYGSTECGGVVSFSAPDDLDDVRPTTSGAPFRGIEVQIRDLENGAVIGAPNERGEIWVRGYNLFEGYHHDAEKNAECFDTEGWFNTGDIGFLDPDGRIAYQGRIKDMLKIGGENVAALEIESFLQTHPAVSIAQVVALPDAKYVEVAAAFVELKPSTALREAELIEFCRGQIATFKIPRYVRFVAAGEWPMSATKIQKFRLRERLCDELGIGDK